MVPQPVWTIATKHIKTKLDVSEIHGYRPELGLSVFTEEALAEEGRRTGRA